ncbi:PREDICTED: killer cell lectin-like receptor subfamily F member 1 isoform X1 [Pseudopodoces humilis]|uniref:killer cell lectin-like receptor subfamily F member 1 isoform X1 n=1 Tax=Pseudopodoces humilis TaxID=181119 RepID=UPI0006B7FA68|nr:PREDICTED: killer cell lectin-like receptor subfamily F member 1 isoform X1 [Pseudopodoces humilis]
MAGDVTYAAVAMLPRERPHTPSGTSNPGSTITYAELHVKRPHGNSRAETSAPDCRHRCSAWFYVALVLAVLVLILLGVVAIQAKQFLKGRAGKSESLPQYGLNNSSSDISSERTDSAALLKWLMVELCENGQGTTCELCPAGWQLHRSRCYFFSEEARSWEDSQKNCLARKSQLLVIEDEIEMEFIDNKDKDTKYIWIGLDTEDMEKTWSSVEDHTVKKQSRTALRSIKADKNCAVYRRKNVIQADNCQTLKEWICKKNATLLVL